jgi:hypothetical protein
MKVSSLEFTIGTCNDVGNRVQLSRQVVFAANIYQWAVACYCRLHKKVATTGTHCLNWGISTEALKFRFTSVETSNLCHNKKQRCEHSLLQI